MSKAKRVFEHSIKVYERLHFFNLHCDAAGQLLKELNRKGAMRKEEMNYFRSLLEEVRACSSQSVAEHMNGHEIMRAANAERKRLNLESRLFRRD